MSVIVRATPVIVPAATPLVFAEVLPQSASARQSIGEM